jgi:hypothetical protein
MALPNRDAQLWANLVALPLDRLAGEPVPEFGFVKRLMREQGWDYAKAIRVVAEYRRFVFLACSGPASPSEAVDAAWHLHLTYTRAYNIGLCERVLGKPLDHTPSGGPADTAHFKSIYENTLDRYRATFNEDAPADIWPPAPVSAGNGSLRAKPQDARYRKRSLVVTACGLVLFASLMIPLKASWVTLGVVSLWCLIALILPAHAQPGNRRRSGGGDSGCGSGGSGCASAGDGGSCGSSCGSSCGGGCGGGCS